MACRLKEENLIRSDFYARIFFNLQQRRDLFLQAGAYSISPSLSLQEMFNLFQHGTFDVEFTIPEGKRLEEVAQLVSEVLDITPFDFFSTAFGNNSLEGKLFPDTYRVPQDIQVEKLVNFISQNFKRKVDGKLQEQFREQGLTLNESVTIASIVEREAKLDEDRPLVAGILIKRYKSDWLLETDATVQYAKTSRLCQLGTECNWWPNNLTAEDLKIDSPYNTRLKAGLPPMPICSPGLKSLTAVAQPLESPYWFYLSDETGKTYYSVSYEEHLVKAEKVLGRY